MIWIWRLGAHRRRATKLALQRTAFARGSQFEDLTPRQGRPSRAGGEVTAAHHLWYQADVHTEQLGGLPLRNPLAHARRVELVPRIGRQTSGYVRGGCPRRASNATQARPYEDEVPRIVSEGRPNAR